MATVNNKNFEAFQAAYYDAAEKELESFMFEDQEVLTKYAYYLIESITGKRP